MAILGRKTLTVGVLVVGAALGAGAVIATISVNKYTATTAFCTSCHSMANLVQDPYYLASAHVSNAKGVIVGCGDCHIPGDNFFVETYTHISQGVKDSIAEQTNNFDDPAVWQVRRRELAAFVREEMRRQDSTTCRGCHDPAKIAPASTAGKAAHALLQAGGLTCIDCHINLVHEPVPPDLNFIRGSGLGAKQEPAQ